MTYDLAGFKERNKEKVIIGREDLARELQRQHQDLTLVGCRGLVETFIEVLKESLLAKKRVEIRGFGVFKAHRRAPRVSFSPVAGKKVKVDARWGIKFTTGKVMKAEMMANCEE